MPSGRNKKRAAVNRRKSTVSRRKQCPILTGRSEQPLFNRLERRRNVDSKRITSGGERASERFERDSNALLWRTLLVNLLQRAKLKKLSPKNAAQTERKGQKLLRKNNKIYRCALQSDEGTSEKRSKQTGEFVKKEKICME